MRGHEFLGRCRATAADGIPVFKRGPWFGYRAHVTWSLGGRNWVSFADWCQYRDEGTPRLVRYRHPSHLKGCQHPFPDNLLEQSGLRIEEYHRWTKE